VRSLRTVALAVVVLAVGATGAEGNRTQLRHDCPKVYSEAYYRVVAKGAIEQQRRVDRRVLYRLASMRWCARSDAAQARMLAYTKRRLAERRAWLADIYWRDRYAAFAPWERNWAYNTGACESGNDPTTNTGNGFYGAFQYVLSTWYSAQRLLPPSRRTKLPPQSVSWFEQAVVSVLYMRRYGNGAWPVCGH